jgi:hypothetical protein
MDTHEHWEWTEDFETFRQKCWTAGVQIPTAILEFFTSAIFAAPIYLIIDLCNDALPTTQRGIMVEGGSCYFILCTEGDGYRVKTSEWRSRCLSRESIGTPEQGGLRVSRV